MEFNFEYFIPKVFKTSEFWLPDKSAEKNYCLVYFIFVKAFPKELRIEKLLICMWLIFVKIF